MIVYNILIYDDKYKLDYNLMKNYIKSLKHIKLIDNKYKKGKIFSIYKGASIAKGKYLLFLNQNCFFINDDALKNINEVIIKDDIDIIELDLFIIFQNNYINLYKCKHFTSSYNVKSIKYNLEFNDIDINNELLTNKLIKNDFFQNVTKKYEIDKFNKLIDHYYNHIFNFIFESTIHEFKHISSDKIYLNETNADKYIFNDFNSEENQTMVEILFYINFIFDKSENTYESKGKALKEFYNLLSMIYNKFTKVSKSKINLLNKFMKCKYISLEQKILLKFYYDSLIC